MSLTPLLIALALVAGYLLWRRQQAAAAAAATVSNPLARAAGSIADTSGAYLDRVPYVGHGLNLLINQPVQNVLHGDVKSTLLSAATGGLWDFRGYL